MKIYTAFILLLVSVAALNGQMIADIQQDVVTDFAVYRPYPVTIVPNADAYTVAADFSNVVNFNNFQFTAAEKALLAKNYFVVTPVRPSNGGTGYREIYDIYNECRELRIPIFVTTDAMLHTFHLCFDNILKICETRRFYGDLNNLLLALLAETQQQYTAAANLQVRQALMTNLNFLIVAEKLLDSTYVEPINGGPYLEELRLVQQHSGFARSPIFGYDEDYSQYIVRGHYTQSDTLRHYFMSMMWLGRMTFARGGTTAPHFSRSALLLTQALERLRINGIPALEVWDGIYTPTVFLVGKSDDLGVLQYRELAVQVYGANFATLAPDTFADETRLNEFLAQVRQLPGPRITFPFQPEGFRLMGQRFIPDSWVLDELVHDKIPGRTMPTGLDIMAVLGSIRALDLLKQSPDWQNSNYVGRLNELRSEFDAYPDSVWAQNVYWSWLYSLMPLFFAKTAGYPMFMQVPAWLDKDLFAALASWAELRHDTILYAKQSGTETGMIPPAFQEQGYVEPNPHLYARLAALAAFLRDGLANRNLLFDSFASALNNLNDLLLQLKQIAEKELTGKSLTPDEYTLICDIGRSIQEIVTFAQHEWEVSSPTPDSDDAMAVVADVHTDANSGLVLEEGVGYPYNIYVIANVEGELKITRGAGFSYHEFTWPMSDRLTDEKWRELLSSTQPPLPPTWSQSFLAVSDNWRNARPDFYYWRCQGMATLVITVTPEAPKVRDTVRVDIQCHYVMFNQEPTLKLYQGATTLPITHLNKISASHYAAEIATGGLSVGQAYLEVDAVVGSSDVWGTRNMHYRTGFYLDPATQVTTPEPNAPTHFTLWPNYPNPFNSATVFKYDLERSGLVQIAIYNLNGQRVRTLAEGYQAAGHYQMTWNGTDDLGVALPSGIYIFRVQTDAFHAERKTLLLR